MAYSEAINKLIADGSRAYSARDYDSASEKYAQACETYSTDHGSEDGDLLLLYGKALFQNAVSKSEVFGGAKENDAETKQDDEEEKEKEDGGNFQFYDAAPAEEVDGEQHQQEEDEPQQEEDEEEQDDDDDDQQQQQDEDPEEEQSDFEVAWEILDLTRTIFEDKLSVLDSNVTPPYLKSDTDTSDNEFVIVTKKLSETLDLLGEVSLEAENFPQSAVDLQSCLELRQKLYNPENSSLISESHYKLSLALEFCVEDPKLREKAADQMKLAIESVKLKNKDEKDARNIADNEELLKDLQVRYRELQRDPAEEIRSEQLDMIKGILGEPTAGAGVNDLSAIIKKKALPVVNDLSGAVKKRKAKNPDGDAKRPKQ